MATPLTGPISYAAVQTEFGGTNPISLNEYFARKYTKPTIVGTAHTSIDAQTQATITLPAGTQTGDKVYLHIVYENVSTLRPTITDFTIETSYNGTLEGVGFTQVFATATIPLSTGQTITISNTAPTSWGGLVASIVVIRGVTAYALSPILSIVPSGSTIDIVKATYSVSYCSTISLAPDEVLVFMAAKDGAADTTYTSWPSTGFTTTDNYLTANGAVLGRAAQIATLTTLGISTLTASNPVGAVTASGTPFVAFTLRGSSTDPSNTNLLIPNLQGLPTSNSQVSLSSFRGAQAFSITPLANFVAGSDSFQSIPLDSLAGEDYVNILVGINIAASGGGADPVSARSWTVDHRDSLGAAYVTPNYKIFDSYAATDSDSHRTVYLGGYLGPVITGDTVRVYWYNGSVGIPNRQQHITVYAVTGIPSMSVYDIKRVVGSAGDASISINGNGRCFSIIQATTNDSSAPTSISNATVGGASSRHASYYNIMTTTSNTHTTTGLNSSGFGQYVAVSFAY